MEMVKDGEEDGDDRTYNNNNNKKRASNRVWLWESGLCVSVRTVSHNQQVRSKVAMLKDGREEGE